MLVKTNLQDYLLDSAKEVFETMIYMDLQPSDTKEHILEGSTFMGLITFSGDIEGCLGICCTKPCASTIAANMLGLNIDEATSDQDIKDAIGEVANMVLGSFKTRVKDEAGDLQVSVPTVIYGKQLHSDMVAKSQKLLLELNIEGEYFAEITLLYREPKS